MIDSTARSIAVNRAARDGSNLIASATNIVRPEMFAAAVSGGNWAPAFQAADTYLVSIGGGVIQASPRTYNFSSSYNPSPNVVLRGSGIGGTIIKAAASGFKLLDTHGGAVSGIGGVEDITLWGYADRNMTQGTDADRLAVIGPFADGFYRRVHAIYGRYVALSCLGTNFIVENCHVEKCLRDGIQANGVNHFKAINNTIEQVADDAIANHVGAGVTGILDRSTIITGNRLAFCSGIKVLGARNAIITGNVGRFLTGYGVNVALDTTFGEGLATKFAVNISNNVFVDTIGLAVLGAGSQTAVITLQGSRSLGSSPTAVSVYPGQIDITTGTFVSPDPYINQAGTLIPRGNDQGIRIAGNIISQTLSGCTNFSDAGFGSMWWTTGLTNPTFATNIALLGGATVNGITLSTGGFSDVEISNNVTTGLASAIFFDTVASLRQVSVTRNKVRRCMNGLAVNLGSAIQVDVDVSENGIDLDPYFEASGTFGRTGTAGLSTPWDGTWKSIGGSNYIAIATVATIGMRVRRNKIRNCMQAWHTGSGSVQLIEDNDCFWDWSGATPKGIGNLSFDIQQNHFYTNSDPTSASYGLHSTTADSGFVRSSGGIPTTGYYRIGQFVAYTAPSLNGNGRYLRGWRRLTNGNAHTAGTDWAQDWHSNASW